MSSQSQTLSTEQQKELAAQKELEKNLQDRYWRLNNLYWITTGQGGQKVVFKMNWAQRLLYRNMWYMNIILKARQLGMSTFILIFILDACLFNKNTKAGVIAHTKDDVKVLFRDKIKFAYDNLDPFIRNSITSKTDSANELVFSNGSSVRVGTSMRSGTLQILHVSEFGKICKKYPEKAREIVTGSFETVHPGQMIFVESTAEGREGYFYDMSVEAKQLFQQIKAGTRKELSMLDFKIHFYPWWKHPYNVLHPEGTIIPPKLKKYFEEKILAKGIKLTAGQMAWYAKKWKTLGSDMLREHPATFSEAFERVVEGAFYGEEIAKARLAGRIGHFAHNPGMEVETWWDLGVNDHTSIWFTQTFGNTINVIDYYENSGEGVRHYIETLEQRAEEEGYKYGRHTWPHDGGHMEFGTGQTRKDRAMELGLRVHVSERGGLQDGIEQCRNTIPMCCFDEEKAYDGLTHLENYRKEWDENLGTWRKTPRHDIHSHGSDAFRTLAMNHYAVATAKKSTAARKVVKANYYYG